MSTQYVIYDDNFDYISLITRDKSKCETWVRQWVDTNKDYLGVKNTEDVEDTVMKLMRGEPDVISVLTYEPNDSHIKGGI